MTDLESKAAIIIDTKLSNTLECNLCLCRAEPFLDGVGESDGSLCLEWDVSKGLVELDSVDVVDCQSCLDLAPLIEGILVTFNVVLKVFHCDLDWRDDVTKVTLLLELRLKEGVEGVLADVHEQLTILNLCLPSQLHFLLGGLADEVLLPLEGALEFKADRAGVASHHISLP